MLLEASEIDAGVGGGDGRRTRFAAHRGDIDDIGEMLAFVRDGIRKRKFLHGASVYPEYMGKMPCRHAVEPRFQCFSAHGGRVDMYGGNDFAGKTILLENDIDLSKICGVGI